MLEPTIGDPHPSLEDDIGGAIVDQFILYDEGVKRWVRQLMVNGESILTVIASPDRAFAAMQRLLDKRKGEKSARTKRAIPLPASSIQRTTESFDLMRFYGQNNKFRKRTPFADAARTKKYEVVAPKPYDFAYQIEYWCRWNKTASKIRTWILQQFQSHETFLLVDLTPIDKIWGRKAIPVQLDNISDTSDLEPGEAAERRVRLTVTFTLKGWIFVPKVAKHTVHTVCVDIAESDDPVNGSAADIEGGDATLLSQVLVNKDGKLVHPQED